LYLGAPVYLTAPVETPHFNRRGFCVSGALETLQKATISFFISIRPSAWKNTKLPVDGASGNLSISRKYVEEIQVLLKFDKNNWYFTQSSMHGELPSSGL
jgi:hypothetical protein